MERIHVLSSMSTAHDINYVFDVTIVFLNYFATDVLLCCLFDKLSTDADFPENFIINFTDFSGTLCSCQDIFIYHINEKKKI